MSSSSPTPRSGPAAQTDSLLRRGFRRGLRSLPPDVRCYPEIALSTVTLAHAQWKMPAYRVRGRLIDGPGDCTLIHFGQQPQYKDWIARFLSRPTVAEAIGSFSLRAICQRKGVLATGDVLLCPVTPLSQLFFAAHGWLTVPKYVRCLIDLRTPIDQLLCRHGVKDDLRIARKKGYRFDILRDDASFDEFYQEMLVPTATVRHEDLAHISSPETLRRIFHRGHLLAAYQGDDWVGASLMVPRPDNSLDWANVGWRGGSERLMKDRLVSALLHEMIVRGKNEGFGTLDLGSCSPFVNDGPLNYKLKWGARMALPFLGYENEQLQGLNAYLAAHFNLASERAQAMLRHAPLLDKHRGRLRAIGWNAALRQDFRHQLDDGLPWADLAAATQRTNAQA